MPYPARIRRLLPILALSGLIASAGAQTAPPPSPLKPAENSAPPAPAPAPQPPRNRGMSSGVAAALAASMPKFDPPPKPAEKTPEEDLPDMREVDKPKNTIVRLPKFVVRESKPPIFRDRDINTRKGLAEIAMRRYLTETDRVLNRFTIPLFHPWSLLGGTSNEDRALAMYEEDERLKNMADVADQTNMVMKANPAAGAKLKSEAQQTFMRWSDFGWNGGSPK